MKSNDAARKEKAGKESGTTKNSCFDYEFIHMHNVKSMFHTYLQNIWTHACAYSSIKNNLKF